MRDADSGPTGPRAGEATLIDRRDPAGRPRPAEAGAKIVETQVSPFHCLYQDALAFHTQSQLALTRSVADSSRLARASLLLYVASAEALIHQAAEELAGVGLASILTDPARPIPLGLAWALLPEIVGGTPGGAAESDAPPWPQLAELIALRTSWAYPGPAPERAAYYRSAVSLGGETSFEPLAPHQVPPGLDLPADRLHLPRTGLPRDPYALRPAHLDTTRSILDAAIVALDRRLGGALTRDNRHRREPIRVIYAGG